MRQAPTLLIPLLLGSSAAWAQVDVSADALEARSTTVLAQNDLEVDIDITSDGYTGPVELKVYTSTDTVFGGVDVEVIDAAVQVSPGSETYQVSTPHPGFLGDYFLLVQLDPDGLITDDDPGNNQAVSAVPVRLRGFDLRIVRLIVQDDPLPIRGSTRVFRIDYRNDGPSLAPNVDVTFEVRPAGGPVRSLRPVAMIGDLANNGTGTESGSFTVPADIAVGEAEFIARIESPSSNLDSAAGNDVAVQRIEIVDRFGDLTGSFSGEAGDVEAGASIVIGRVIENSGVADIDDPSRVAFVLSSDDVIEEDDLAVGSANVPALSLGAISTANEAIRVPVTVTPGRYWLGMLLDADEVIPETNEANNEVLGPEFEVFAPDLAVLTSTLPVARRGVPYSVGLIGVGGTQTRLWSVTGLPSGLELSEGDGILSGTPLEVGTFAVTLTLTSGNASVNRTLELRVVEPTLPLSVPSRPLPVGVIGRRYSASLIPTGGIPPYTWSSTTVPAGLELGTDGRLSGAPQRLGSFAFDAEVEDDLGASARGTFTLDVVPTSSAVDISGVELPDATLGLPYAYRFMAQGGSGPFVFSAGALPAGLSLSTDGVLDGVPTQVGRETFSINVRNDLGLVDSASFSLEVLDDDALRVATESLPSARVGVPYDVALAATGGIPPLSWRRFGEQTLPPGLEIGDEGMIRGTPTAANVFRFAVEVRDAAGRIARAPLEIRVERGQDGLDGNGSGCGAAAGSDLLLGLLLGGWALRRRRST